MKRFLIEVATIILMCWLAVLYGRMLEMDATRTNYERIPWGAAYEDETWMDTVDGMERAGGWMGKAALVAKQGYVLGVKSCDKRVRP